MVSREGFETWFDYQIGLTLLAIAAVALLWFGDRVVDAVSGLGLPAERLALVVAGACLVGVVLLLALTRQFG